MSRRVYDSLSPEAKHALDVNSGEAASRDCARWWDRNNEMSRESAKRDPKHTVVTLDPAMRAKWSVKLDGAIAEWAKSRPGIDQALAAFKRLVAEVQAEH